MMKLLCLSSVLAVASATLGVDVSQATSTSSFSCMKSDGYSFAIVRVYESSGKVDPNGANSISHAWSGGMSHVDGYIFPCYSCGNAAGQVDAVISSLSAANVNFKARPAEGEEEDISSLNATKNGATYGMLWIDVEGSQYWSSSTSNNVNFIQEMAKEGVARGVSMGVYTSSSQWSAICGSSTAMKSYPLWYPHYQSPAQPNYNDWVSFGGWTSPAIKQYAGDITLCSAGVDTNYY